jgi:hypothetical protein
MTLPRADDRPSSGAGWGFRAYDQIRLGLQAYMEYVAVKETHASPEVNVSGPREGK